VGWVLRQGTVTATVLNCVVIGYNPYIVWVGQAQANKVFKGFGLLQQSSDSMNAKISLAFCCLVVGGAIAGIQLWRGQVLCI